MKRFSLMLSTVVVAFSFSVNAQPFLSDELLIKVEDGIACLARLDLESNELVIQSSGLTCTFLKQAVYEIPDKYIKRVKEHKAISVGGFLGYFSEIFQVSDQIILKVSGLNGQGTEKYCLGKIERILNEYALVDFSQAQLEGQEKGSSFSCKSLSGDLYLLSKLELL